MSRQLRLMPAASVRRQAVSEALHVWVRVLAVVVFACAVVTGVEVWRCREATQQREALEAQHAPIDQLRTDIRLLKTRIVNLEKNEQIALDLANRQSMVALVGQIGQAAAYAGGDLFVQSLHFIRHPATLEQPSTLVATLDGAARDNLAITRFVEGLRDSGMFAEVQLTSTESRAMSQQAVTAFNLECVF